MNLQGAIERNYPLMGFSFWHRLVANSLCPVFARGHNACIEYKGVIYVIKGRTFEDTNYFMPQLVVNERWSGFPKERKEISLSEYSRPHEIATVIRNMSGDLK